MNLKNLFSICLTILYEKVGDDVSYATQIDKVNNVLYIFFQGSASVEDWKNNFDFKEKAYGIFKVHRGFYRCYYQVRNILLDNIYQNNYKKVVVVGYSHGGALCGLATQDIRYHFPKLEVEGYGFEAPRFVKVNKKLKYMFDDFTLIRTNNDLITHLPPKIFGFSDVGKMLKIKGDTSLVKNHLPKCIKSHYPEVVLDALSKIEH
jgi:predicted lipase